MRPLISRHGQAPLRCRGVVGVAAKERDIRVPVNWWRLNNHSQRSRDVGLNRFLLRWPRECGTRVVRVPGDPHSPCGRRHHRPDDGSSAVHASLLVLIQGRPGRPTPTRCGNMAPASPQGSNYRTRLRGERPDMRARERRGERKQVRDPTEHEDLELRRRLLGRQRGQRFAPRRGPNQPGALRCTDAWRRRTAERDVVIRGEHPLAGCRMDGPARCTVVTDRKREFRLIANFRDPLRDPQEYDNQTCNDFGG